MSLAFQDIQITAPYTKAWSITYNLLDRRHRVEDSELFKDIVSNRFHFCESTLRSWTRGLCCPASYGPYSGQTIKRAGSAVGRLHQIRRIQPLA